MATITLGKTSTGTLEAGFADSAMIAAKLTLPAETGRIAKMGFLLRSTNTTGNVIFSLYNGNGTQPTTKIADLASVPLTNVDAIHEITVDQPYTPNSEVWITARSDSGFRFHYDDDLSLPLFAWSWLSNPYPATPQSWDAVTPQNREVTAYLIIETDEPPPPPECSIDSDCAALYGAPASGYHWECQSGTCVQVQDDIIPPPPLTFTINIAPSMNGTTNPTGLLTLNEGESVTVTAIPNTGYTLKNWLLNDSEMGTINPITVIATQNHMLQAEFMELEPSNGKDFYALGGTAPEIQAAVNQAASAGGGNVYVPAGVFSWHGELVTVPAGVNVYGAATARDSNDQVIDWNTRLVSESDFSGTFFQILGNGDSLKPSRFSDIELIGYRNANPTSITMPLGIRIESVMNWRVDHCSFLDICGGAIYVVGMNAHVICGVLDHSRLVNSVGIPDPYDNRTVGYGISMNSYYLSSSRTPEDWIPDIKNVLGQYTTRTVFIEDCYFSRWRHCAVGNLGTHYVFRHNVIQYGFGYGEIDVHTSYEGDYGGRAVEIYDNQFLDLEPFYEWQKWASEIKSGGGVIFNNSLSGYNLLSYIYGLTDNLNVWLNSGGALDYGSNVQIGVNLFLDPPTWYAPYPYPHPLTLGIEPPPPPPPECSIDSDCAALYGAPASGYHWECQSGTCVQVQDDIIPPPPPKSGQAVFRGHVFLGYAETLPKILVHGLWRLREHYVRKEVHRKLHPLI